MSTRGHSMEAQTAYKRQAVILRKNIGEWDRTVRAGLTEDWPKSLGRLNAALNQTVNMDRSIDDVLEHFVYLPLKATANPQDIPFFLSTRLEDEGVAAATAAKADKDEDDKLPEFSLDTKETDPVKHLAQYEKQAAVIAADYERQMIRFE